IEEDPIAFVHGLQVVPGGEIAHPGPGFDIVLHLLIPAEGVRFGLHQPMAGHSTNSPSRNTGRIGRTIALSNRPAFAYGSPSTKPSASARSATSMISRLPQGRPSGSSAGPAKTSFSR